MGSFRLELLMNVGKLVDIGVKVMECLGNPFTIVILAIGNRSTLFQPINRGIQFIIEFAALMISHVKEINANMLLYHVYKSVGIL